MRKRYGNEVDQDCKKLQAKPSQMIVLAFLNPYTSVKTSPMMYVRGNRITAAGSVMSDVTAHIFPAMRFDSKRHATKTMPMHMNNLDTVLDSLIIFLQIKNDSKTGVTFNQICI